MPGLPVFKDKVGEAKSFGRTAPYYLIQKISVLLGNHGKYAIF
jgi:hypothetical protein